MNATTKNTDRQIGFNEGVKYMEEKILSACKSGKGILIANKMYFIKTDIQHLREIIDKIGVECV